jgi:hypothetical protein
MTPELITPDFNWFTVTVSAIGWFMVLAAVFSEREKQ